MLDPKTNLIIILGNALNGLCEQHEPSIGALQALQLLRDQFGITSSALTRYETNQDRALKPTIDP